MRPYLRAALCVAVLTALALATTFVGARAEPSPVDPPSGELCIPAGMVRANLAPGSDFVNLMTGESAQKISDALGILLNAPTLPVAAFTAFIRGQVVKAFGYDSKGCVIISGEISLATYALARKAAGLGDPVAIDPPEVPAKVSPVF